MNALLVDEESTGWEAARPLGGIWAVDWVLGKDTIEKLIKA